NEEHLQQAISLYEETKDQMTYFAEGELLMISGFSEYAQTADTRNLKRAKMLFELLLSTLNSRLSRLESVRQQLQSSTLLIDISKTQSKIEDQIIVMLKLIINVKMKLACDEILRGQFCQLFDLLKKRAAYQDIMQYLNSYVDIHGYLDSPMNYQVILHAAQLYFECISVLQKELLAHPYADTVKKNIDGNNLVAIPSTIGMAMSLPNQVAVDAQDAATYHKVIGALNKVFTDFLATSTSEKIVSGINLTDYQNISRIAYTYLNTPQRALAIVLIKFLSENVYREVLKFTQNETASARQSPNPFRGNNSQCFFQKRAGSRTMQFDIGWETTFAQAFPELNRVEVRNKVVRFLTDKAVEQDLVNKLTNWINQNFRIVPRDIGINSEGGVTVVFMTDETASSFLHTLIFPELYKSGISVSWSHDNNPSPTTSVRQPVQPTVPAPLSPTIQVLRVAPQVAVQPSAQPVVQASNVQSSTSRGSQLSQSFGNISLNRLPPPPRANFLGGAASNSSSAISPRTLPSTSVPNNSASLPLQPNDTVVPTAGVSTPSPRALPNAPVPNNSAGLPSQPNNKAISTTSVSTPSPRALPSAPVPNNAAGLPPRPSNMVIPTASVATPSRSLGRQPGPTGAA
ncbi:MAG: hypothetical protein JSS53_00570, partial [Proteobacteria bacterium]|nr:hypothetical protein [Pseudomonadota bacterium]